MTEAGAAGKGDGLREGDGEAVAIVATLGEALAREPLVPLAPPAAVAAEDAAAEDVADADGAGCLLRDSPTYAMARTLPEEALRAVVAIRDWLLGEARISRDFPAILSGLCERLNAAGVPVDRGAMAIRTLHAQLAAVGHFWIKGEDLRQEGFAFTPQSQANYERSPYFEARQNRRALELWLPDTPDERFGIVAGLKAAGYTHYLCFPIFFAGEDESGVAFATKSPAGFSDLDRRLIEFTLPTLGAVMEIANGHRTLDHVLRVYVGDEPHKEILAGSVRRGQTSRIRSAILFADMRGYTSLSSTREPEDIVALLNLYFDCLVPAIEAEGGEVLKYMGDGLLAIFRDKGDDTGGAAAAALAAARAGLAALDAANAEGHFAPPLEAGIALHHGEAAYGNVGSGLRLDFTVVGRDVNLASRIARLNKVLGERLLMSAAFADHLWGAPTRLGAFPADGFAEPVVVYRP